MSNNITVRCVRCGHLNSIWIPKGNHSKDNDPRFEVCELCGDTFEEE